ncbi:PRTRC system ThiF family protein [Chitinophaga jiangningensis]|uniref:PRTRC system ThiF family protein n=1 Tax=Chitinophaga jiangningensis TaxID=1419482 RepID=A0A1M6WIE0_9BACT|nr:PRTRC system ThiF family protein [Chitinophaga jiangningensis]SHK93458.1 PRTRC system ThiF family protein [Chitinophaga jiangningensis]
MKIHYTAPYLLDPTHRVTIHLIGVGGTGSLCLTHLARLNEALLALGHPGIHVRCWDDDTVSEANIGRQLFSAVDIGLHKSVVLISRVNRFFGYNWEAYTEKFTGENTANIIMSCIDTAAGRIKIYNNLQKLSVNHMAPDKKPLYWLDMGNLQRTGQVVLGTISSIEQPQSTFPTCANLPTVVDIFPQLRKLKEKDQGPSCSLAEALNKQDLFINSSVANFGCQLLWRLFREGSITQHGCFVNLETCCVNPLPIG